MKAQEDEKRELERVHTPMYLEKLNDLKRRGLGDQYKKTKNSFIYVRSTSCAQSYRIPDDQLPAGKDYWPLDTEFRECPYRNDFYKGGDDDAAPEISIRAS